MRFRTAWRCWATVRRCGWRASCWKVGRSRLAPSPRGRWSAWWVGETGWWVVQSTDLVVSQWLMGASRYGCLDLDGWMYVDVLCGLTSRPAGWMLAGWWLACALDVIDRQRVGAGTGWVWRLRQRTPSAQDQACLRECGSCGPTKLGAAASRWWRRQASQGPACLLLPRYLRPAPSALRLPLSGSRGSIGGNNFWL